jgi:DNA helicase IV
MKALKDEETGGLYVYSDENQRIFARFGQPPVPLVPLVLDHNLRNTQQIAKAFGPLAPMRMHLKGGEGAEVTFIACDSQDVVDVADEQVDRLLDSGWEPEHVALLTMGSRHPIQMERWAAEGQQGYWRAFWENDDVFYGHVLGCKGLERKAVVLCVNLKSTERAKEMLYVGMSRATDELVVVGDPALIREIGGEQVARQLGIPS